MTNEQLFEDLKQLVTVTVSQSEERVTAHVDQCIDNVERRISGIEQGMVTGGDIRHLGARLDELQDSIAETLEHVVEAIDTTKQVRELERRVHRLERHAA